MNFLTFFLTGLLSGAGLFVQNDTTKTLDLSGTVIVNAHYAQEPVASLSVSPSSVVDTVDTANEFVKIALFADKTWRFVKLPGYVQDKSIFKMHWDTYSVNPYQKTVEELPEEWAIWLVDSLNQYHRPVKNNLKVRSAYGPRNNRIHQGVDLSIPAGTPIYAAFTGQVRVSRFSDKGYGNIVIIRHENGLETVYAHLSERKVEVGDWVDAGHIIGLCGSTGRSTGPHLHFEVRYQGFSFDPEWIMDFATGELNHRLFVLKKKYFGVNHAAAQNFEDEAKAQEEASQKAKQETEPAQASKPAQSSASKTTSSQTKKTTASNSQYYVVVEGDTLYAIASRNKTSVAALCKLNNIEETSILSIGQKIKLR